MFMDQRLEKLVLGNANNSISKVNNDIFEQFARLTKSGILCRQRGCGVCKRHIDSGEVTLQDGYNFEVSTSTDDDGDAVHVFACMHQFHVRCLKSYYLRQFGNTVASREEIERVFTTAPEKLRCITCNLKSIDLESEKRKAAGVSAPKPAPTKPQQAQEGEAPARKPEARTSVYRQ